MPPLSTGPISSTEHLLEFHKQLTDQARELMANKNADYTNRCEGGNPFLNFTRCESMGICSVEQGFLVRLTDKMSRLSTFCNGNKFKVADESVTDTILDVINYATLFLAYTQSKEVITNTNTKTKVDNQEKWPLSQSLPVEIYDK